MKYAIKVREILTRVVIVEADDYLEAKDKVEDAYYQVDLELNADNSTVDLEFENNTDNYIEMFGEEEFQLMEVSDEIN